MWIFTIDRLHARRIRRRTDIGGLPLLGERKESAGERAKREWGCQGETEDVSIAVRDPFPFATKERRWRARSGRLVTALATTAFLAYDGVLHHFTSLCRPSAGRSATRGNLGGHVGGHYSSCTPARTHTSYEPPCTACCLPSAERTFGFATPVATPPPSRGECWRRFAGACVLLRSSSSSGTRNRARLG